MKWEPTLYRYNGEVRALIISDGKCSLSTIEWVLTTCEWQKVLPISFYLPWEGECKHYEILPLIAYNVHLHLLKNFTSRANLSYAILKDVDFSLAKFGCKIPTKSISIDGLNVSNTRKIDGSYINTREIDGCRLLERIQHQGNRRLELQHQKNRWLLTARTSSKPGK